MFVQLSKPKPNMLKTLLIIPSSTSQKFTHYSYFILISLPVTPILFFVFYCFACWHLEKHEINA